MLKAELPLVAAIHAKGRLVAAPNLEAPLAVQVHHPVRLVFKAELPLDALHTK